MATVATYSGRTIVWSRMKGNNTEAKNIGWGIGTQGSSAASDVNLFIPSTEARTAGTSAIITTSQLGDTYQVTGTITATGSRAITECGLFDTTTASPFTTVTGTLTSGATGSQVVGSTTNYPGSGNFYCQIDNEVVVATVVDGTHLNLLTRGVNGSSAASHSAGATIVLGGDGGANAAGATSSQTSTNPVTGGSAATHADFTVINLNTNDSIAFTWKWQLS